MAFTIDPENNTAAHAGLPDEAENLQLKPVKKFTNRKSAVARSDQLPPQSGQW
jgi:hypothetical protein